ncbi:MAG: hypothetical protein MZW92_04025 [Comamonadaceae bacterium]|nr:hypothetical protein [Comamonadaceae bacterium]
MTTADEVTQLILAGLPVRRGPRADRRRHAFRGRRHRRPSSRASASLQRHQLVYAGLGASDGPRGPRAVDPGLHACRVAGRAGGAAPR